MKMEGLFYHHDSDGLTFLRFFSDGRVISFGKSTRFDQVLLTFPRFRVESDKVHYSRGIYHIDIWDNIRIVLKGCLGKMEYNGFIRDEDTIDLLYSCPFTCARKLVTFLRYSIDEHIIHIEISDAYPN